jgi:hypothetical protein
MAQFFSCPVCRSRVPHFVPLPKHYENKMRENGFPYPISQFETINEAAYSCPKCQASDRDRFYALFFEPVFVRLNHALPFHFLEVAPARALSGWIKSHPHIVHRSCDLYMPEADDKADLHNLPYRDGSFDFILCSHVLEHVDDPVKATSEMRRVLKPDGVAVIMAPIVRAILDTYENPAAVTPEDRWKHFGQDDHVRLFSKFGFVDTIRRGGLDVQQVPVSDMMAAEACETHGIAPGSVLYLGINAAAA